MGPVTRLLKSACVLGIVIGGFLSAIAQNSVFNDRRNTLIADQFNNRVTEVDRKGNIVWQFGLGPADFTPASIIGTNDAERVGTLTLMAGDRHTGRSARSA
ncbi:MAG TPA: hypothetical protein VFB24_13880 [Candidatus Binatia bacterium]|nr:hypothetical protein [Candidatus Binatia bacterium]